MYVVPKSLHKIINETCIELGEKFKNKSNKINLTLFTYVSVGNIRLNFTSIKVIPFNLFFYLVASCNLSKQRSTLLLLNTKMNVTSKRRADAAHVPNVVYRGTYVDAPSKLQLLAMAKVK